MLRQIKANGDAAGKGEPEMHGISWDRDDENFDAFDDATAVGDRRSYVCWHWQFSQREGIAFVLGVARITFAKASNNRHVLVCVA